MTLNIGLIGYGARGNLVEQAHRPDLGARVVALADPNEEVHPKFCQEVGQDAWITRDYRALLERPEFDAVVIVTPDFLHEEHAVAALEAGKTVYLDIPKAEGSHGGADPAIMGEFLRFVREGGATETSPVAARASVAAGCLATHSLRNGGVPCEVPPLDPKLVTYFAKQP